MEIRREAQGDQFDSSMAIMQAGGMRDSRESWQGRLGPELDGFECHREEVFKSKYKKAEQQPHQTVAARIPWDGLERGDHTHIRTC